MVFEENFWWFHLPQSAVFNAFSVLGIPTGDTQNTKDLGTGVDKTLWHRQMPGYCTARGWGLLKMIDALHLSLRSKFPRHWRKASPYSFFKCSPNKQPCFRILFFDTDKTWHGIDKTLYAAHCLEITLLSHYNGRLLCPAIMRRRKSKVNIHRGRSNLKRDITKNNWSQLSSRSAHVTYLYLWSLPTVCCTPITVQEARHEVEPWFARCFKTLWKVSKSFVFADSDRHSFDSSSASNHCICLLQGPKEGIQILMV